MASDTTPELSIEQLISALNQRLFMECERVQSAMPPVSRSLVAKLTCEVQSQDPIGKPRTLTIPFTGQCSRETSQGRPTRDCYFKELTATCEPSPSGSPRIMRHLRLRHRSEADPPLDSCLSILAEVHQFQSEELGVDINRVEAIGTSVHRTCRGSPTGHRHHRT